MEDTYQICQIFFMIVFHDFDGYIVCFSFFNWGQEFQATNQVS